VNSSVSDVFSRHIDKLSGRDCKFYLAFTLITANWSHRKRAHYGICCDRCHVKGHHKRYTSIYNSSTRITYKHNFRMGLWECARIVIVDIHLSKRLSAARLFKVQQIRHFDSNSLFCRARSTSSAEKMHMIKMCNLFLFTNLVWNICCSMNIWKVTLYSGQKSVKFYLPIVLFYLILTKLWMHR